MPSHPGDEHDRPWTHRDDRLPIDPDLAPDDPGEPSVLHHPIPHVHRARQGAVVAAIALGGFLGTLGRYELELVWPTVSGHVPWATLLINTSGALLLGLILTTLLERPAPARYIRPFLCTGAIGGWTTMSGLAVELDQLVRHGHLGVALAYLVATTILGVATGWVGVLLARRFDPRRVPWASY